MKNNNVLNDQQFQPLGVDMLSDVAPTPYQENERISEERKAVINNIFSDFGIKASVDNYVIGPTYTRFNVKYSQNVSSRAISNIISDMQIRLGGVAVRFESTSRGKDTSGIEIANEYREYVSFKEVYQDLPSVKEYPLAVAFGKDVDRKTVWFDLEDAPHILLSGTTGSGKSVFLNSLIMSLMMRLSPDDVRFVIFDPKHVEFSRYTDMPHLLCPIIKGVNDAKDVLNKLLKEMENRYELLCNKECSNIKEYNEDALKFGFDKLPYIIVIIDEYADLADTDIEVGVPLLSLAQKARAAGIHLVVSTQRPATRFITGALKANLPLHMAFMCASMVDSMTMIGETGAEKLTGRGDMLVECQRISLLGVTRYQGCYVDRTEVKNVVAYMKEHFKTVYDDNFVLTPNFDPKAVTCRLPEEEQEKYKTIKEWALNQEFISVSRIQRECAVGFNRACRFFAELQAEGIVATEAKGNKGYPVIKK